MKFKTIANLNVRSGPGSGYRLLKTFSPGQIIEEVSILGWCPISLDSGSIGWIVRKYLAAFTNIPEVPGQIITGGNILAQAEKHLTKPPQKYVLGANVDLNDPNWKGPWDCAEQITYDVKQVTGKIYGALRPESSDPEPWTGAWYNDMKAGRVIQVPLEQAIRTPGAILLVFSKKHQHIAFTDGQGGTVESKGAAYGLIRDVAKGRGFQYGILIPNVQYKAT